MPRADRVRRTRRLYDATTHHVLALALVAAAFTLQVALATVVPNLHPYASFHVAVTLAAAMGGAGPGLVAVASSLLAALHFRPLGADVDAGLRWMIATALFLVTSAVTLIVLDRLRTNRRVAGEERAALRRDADRHARATVEAANRELLAMLGHELRNPLSAIRTAVVVARLDVERRGNALDIARRQSDRLALLVDGLLDVARVTRGKIPLCRTRLALGAVVEGAVDAVHDLAEERRQAIRVHLSSEPIQVEGDYVRLVQAVTNLLDNAAKYTSPGGHIDVAASRHDGVAEITVQDDGPGVPRALAPRVFDLFTQGERAIDRRAGGLGVGLTVVKRIAELHGGSVRYDAQPTDVGARFVLSLPTLPSAGDGATADIPTERPMRVLLAEHNVAMADAFVVQLQEMGHEVLVAHDGLAALGVVRLHPPDIALVDVDLPGMDGYELARRIRGCANAEKIRLVALVGHQTGNGAARRMAGSGFERTLAKPAEPEALRAVLSACDTGPRAPSA